MKQLCVVVVFIWYICENDIFLFTRAAGERISFSLKDAYDMRISCNNSLIGIVNVSLDEESVPCKETKCLLDDKDIKAIRTTCDGSYECLLGTKWFPSCIPEYGYFNVSYICNATCNFEESKCGFDTSLTDNPSWTYVSGKNSTLVIGDNSTAIPDHTKNTTDGHFMIIKLTGNGEGKMKTGLISHEGYKCLSFWSYCATLGDTGVFGVTLNVLLNDGHHLGIPITADSNWHFNNLSIFIKNGDYISFQTNFKDQNVLIGIDDVSLSVISNSMTICDKGVSVPSSHEITTYEPQSAKYTTMGRQTVSTISQTDDTSLSRQTTATSSQTEDYPDNFRSSSQSSTSVTGIVVGVVLSVVAISVCLVIAVIFFRRSRYFEKKANPIVVEKNKHNDYTGHQNVAFSPEVNVTTQTDYCEIRTSKHNEQYHDISDTFRPLITTTDDEYSEIANVVNSPNNPNASTNYQHQYISLDPNSTGFDRSNQNTNLRNEKRKNNNSNEKTSFTGGDDYAILDPDDLNESKNNAPKVLPSSENYVVLDPNETGFNRQKNTNTVCNYELATPINPTETSEDPYDVSKDETNDTSSNSRHKEKDNNIYSHMVDNMYDTAGNQRKKEDNDCTYDHFFGQQSEDDYDISKPL